MLCGPAADIDDGGVLDCPDKPDQLQRESGRFLKPADLALALGGVDLLPVALTAHVVHGLVPRCMKVPPGMDETGGECQALRTSSRRASGRPPRLSIIRNENSLGRPLSCRSPFSDK